MPTNTQITNRTHTNIPRSPLKSSLKYKPKGPATPSLHHNTPIPIRGTGRPLSNTQIPTPIPTRTPTSLPVPVGLTRIPGIPTPLPHVGLESASQTLGKSHGRHMQYQSLSKSGSQPQFYSQDTGRSINRPSFHVPAVHSPALQSTPSVGVIPGHDASVSRDRGHEAPCAESAPSHTLERTPTSASAASSASAYTNESGDQHEDRGQIYDGHENYYQTQYQGTNYHGRTSYQDRGSRIFDAGDDELVLSPGFSVIQAMADTSGDVDERAFLPPPPPPPSQSQLQSQPDPARRRSSGTHYSPGNAYANPMPVPNSRPPSLPHPRPFSRDVSNPALTEDIHRMLMNVPRPGAGAGVGESNALNQAVDPRRRSGSVSASPSTLRHSIPPPSPRRTPPSSNSTSPRRASKTLTQQQQPTPPPTQRTRRSSSPGSVPTLIHELNTLLGYTCLDTDAVNAALREVEADIPRGGSPPPVFNTPLHITTHYASCSSILGGQTHTLPVVVFACVEELYRAGLRSPRLLRPHDTRNPTAPSFPALIAAFNTPPAYGDNIDLSRESLDDVGALLVTYLDCLPGGVFGGGCVRAALGDVVRRDLSGSSASPIRAAQLLLRLLPRVQRSVLVYLLAFLAQVPLYEAWNGWNQRGVARAFARVMVGVEGRLGEAGCTGGKGKGRQSAEAERDWVADEEDAVDLLEWLLAHWDAISEGLFDPEDGNEGEKERHRRAALRNLDPGLPPNPLLLSHNLPAQYETELRRVLEDGERRLEAAVLAERTRWVSEVQALREAWTRLEAAWGEVEKQRVCMRGVLGGVVGRFVEGAPKAGALL